MRKGVLISGYYGAGNTGDEAILSGMLAALRAQGIEDITVLSRNPIETTKLHGVDSLHCGRRLSGLLPVFRKLRRSKLFILGGGGLLQDHSSRVVPFWLSRVAMAFAAGTPVMYYAQGIGPLDTPQARRWVRLFSKRVKRITVRDHGSLELLREMGVSGVPMEVTADPALGIRITSDGSSLLKAAGVDLLPSKLKIGISLRSWEGEKDYLPVLIRVLKGLRQEFDLQYIFFPFQYGCDEKVSSQVLEAVASEGDRIVSGSFDPEQMAAMLGKMDGVIAMRLHAVILSAISGVPAFGLIYDPKVRGFMERAGIADFSIAIDEIAAREDLFYQQISEWLPRAEVIGAEMCPRVEAMSDLAERNAVIVSELMASKE